MAVTKKIKSLYVVQPGSNPDVDSDFNTEFRGDAIEHVRELYGNDNVASIGTFTTLAAKSAFNTMCTIYEVPFAQATKIAGLIPPDIEGNACTVEDIFNPYSDRYSDAVDFRNATSGDEWKKIIEGAKAIEGRNKTTGVHPCGIVISSKPLINTVPLQIRQSDGLVVTQWGYQELESLGLIKMDFLGLDTVDLIQHTVENIAKAGKGNVNMVDILNGPMDDKKTFEMLARGDSIGIFQLASPGVQELLKRIKPTGVEDIIATTALYRPGPMGMQSHVKYADRKNGREDMDYVHEEFKNSPLVQILGRTYGLVVYQEQVMQLAAQITGFTLQEADDLRSAMGKKKMDKMLKAKPLFMAGGKTNGYSEEALQLLWDTISEFAKYGFNRAHSVGYGIIAYQAAYLKANYPVEFMAALISQNIGNKEKISVFLREARRMKLKVGSIDINVSEVRVAPDFTGKSGFDIVFGLSGVNAVSEDVAALIVKERQNGEFTSVQDFVTRCYSRGVTNKKVYENIAKAGGFGSFAVTRRGVVENLSSLLEGAKTKGSKGVDLFDLFGGGASIEASSVDLGSISEYPHVDKLKMEADVIGLYLTSHPLSNVGPGLSKARTSTIESLMKSQSMATVKITGALTDIAKKIMRKGGKAIRLTLDDGTGYIEANLSRELVKGIDKTVAQERIRKLYEAGETVVPEELSSIATSLEFTAIDDLEKNSVYSMTLNFRPGRDDSPYNARVTEIEKLHLSDDGSLPIRMRLLYDDKTEPMAHKLERSLPKAIANRNPGPFTIMLAIEPRVLSLDDENALYHAALEEMAEDAKTVRVAEAEKSGSNLWGDTKLAASKTKVNIHARVWPPEYTSVDTGTAKTKLTEERVRRLTYVDTGYKAAKSKAAEMDIEKYLGVESYDFGVFDPSVLED
jgi:DNA polymerase-3 subunit alpha